MQIKRIGQKLHLNKETVSNLNNAEMSHVLGGVYTGNSCVTELRICTQPRCCERSYDCKTIQIC
jgi:hypothetical protein